MLANSMATQNLVQGNMIGTNLAGTARLDGGINNGNTQAGAGVYLDDAPDNTIGGAMPRSAT